MNKKYCVAAWMLLDVLLMKAAFRLEAAARWARTKASRHLSLLLVTAAVASLRIVSVAILVSPVILLGAML